MKLEEAFQVITEVTAHYQVNRKQHEVIEAALGLIKSELFDTHTTTTATTGTDFNTVSKRGRKPKVELTEQ